MNTNLTKSMLAVSCVALLMPLLGCSQSVENTASQNAHYSMEDFAKIKKIDAHVHANNMNLALIEQAKQDNFMLITINVDYPDFPALDVQEDIALSLVEQFPEVIQFATTFSMQGWPHQNFSQSVIQQIDRAVEHGAIAVKVWKNIGMSYRGENEQLVMIDDPGFDPVFSHLEEYNIPLIGHQGEPYNCWLPVEEMSVNNDKLYFANHPQYHMYLHPEMPSYQAQLDARNTMLKNHPRLNFIGAHMGSMEWNVDLMATFLDNYPTAYLDMAARMGQIQAQSVDDRDKVIKFVKRYQDRLVYATDLTHGPEDDGSAFKQSAHSQWLDDWRYLNTASEFETPQVDGAVKGLALPKSVIDKIYRLNAMKFFQLN